MRLDIWEKIKDLSEVYGCPEKSRAGFVFEKEDKRVTMIFNNDGGHSIYYLLLHTLTDTPQYLYHRDDGPANTHFDSNGVWRMSSYWLFGVNINRIEWWQQQCQQNRGGPIQKAEPDEA
jgi:hypothetical protein